MCIICASPKGIRQPTKKQIKTMFERNPHGAGYMYAKDGRVIIHKGFMDISDLLAQLDRENFTPNDPVVYHFRISTQAHKLPSMTHPFPLTKNLSNCEALDVLCSCGVAHNGIIYLTSNGSTRYSDTALFITKYMSRLIRGKSDIQDEYILDTLRILSGSKLAILDGDGDMAFVGQFVSEAGLLFSNHSYLPAAGR